MKKSLVKELAVIALFAVILFLFYRSFWAFLLLPPVVVIYHRKCMKERKALRSQELSFQFKDALESVTAALRAGYSFENSLSEAAREMASLYGSKAAITKELNHVCSEISLGINTETALTHLAERARTEDIDIFVSVFRIALKSGGDMVDIIRKTAGDITARIDTRNEISVLISAKKLEQTIMSFMPMGIIIYIGIASPDILAPLYGNITGVIIMTICLFIYAAAYFISAKIMAIEV